MIPFMGTNAFSSVQPFVGLRHNTTESTSEQRNIPTRERVMGRGEGENGRMGWWKCATIRRA